MLVAGARRTRCAEPLRAAGGHAAALGARPLLEEIDALARRGRLDLRARRRSRATQPQTRST